MALSAAATAALKKLATAAATDKNVAKTIGTAAAVALFVTIVPVLALLALLNSGSQMDFAALAAQPPSESLAQFEQIMLAIEDEIVSQNLSLDPIEAQMIYLCALQGREKEDGFYQKYITCFAESQDVFAAISEAFGVEFTPQDIDQLEQLIAMAKETQSAPPNGIHAKILELTQEEDTPATPGAFSSPFHDRDWKSLVTSGFWMRVHPITGEHNVHTGVDFGVPEGTNIYPAKPGKVLLVGNDQSGYGLYVVVSHGSGETTLYGHCAKILAAQGDAVDFETVLALSGSSGQSTGPHLHWEIILDGKPINPRKYIK